MGSSNKKETVYYSQLWLLLWKNLQLQKRSIIGSIIELTLPAIFAIILIPIRTIVKSDHKLNDTTYGPFTINKLDEFFLNGNFSFGYFPKNSTKIDNMMKKIANRLELDSTKLKCIVKFLYAF